MSQFLLIVLATAAAYAAMHVLPLLIVIVRAMRTPIHPIRFETVQEPSLDPDQELALQQLQDLGFKPIAWKMVLRGDTRHLSVSLRHDTGLHFADVTFIANGMADYPVAFYSFGPTGTLNVTLNRSSWGMVTVPDDVILHDAEADNLEDHWRRHQQFPVAAEEIETAQALARIQRLATGHFDRLREKGAIHQVSGSWYYTLPTAARIASAWWSIRRVLVRPYHGIAMEESASEGYFTRLFADNESFLRQRETRRDIKYWLFGLSLVISMAGWGLYFGWAQGLALVAILLLHEGGHAIAMYAFGFRDMHMLFVPMLGAVVTGEPAHLPAWKQTIVLLAGPLPGLLLGVTVLLYMPAVPGGNEGFDWLLTAYMAIGVNLFNLLPITPLDGGQLVEVALFRRWPRVRFAFHLVSLFAIAVLAIWLDGVFIWILVAVLALSTPMQWRLSRIQSTWRDGLSETEQLVHLFAETARLQKLNLQRRYALVKSTMYWHAIRPARSWEAASIMVLLVSLWLAVFVAFYGTSDTAQYADTTGDVRDPQQIAFDEAYDYGGGDIGRLTALAVPLASDDPRRIDLKIMQIRSSDPDQHAQRYASLLITGRDGRFNTLQDVAEYWLAEVHDANIGAPPLHRAKALQEAVAALDAMAPTARPGTLKSRLLIAEAHDQAGGLAYAIALLDAIDIELGTDCTFDRQQLIRARTWLYLTHHQPQQAIAAIEDPSCTAELEVDFSPLARDHAWTLLAVGRSEEGVAEMRRGSYDPGFKPTLQQRLSSHRDIPPRLFFPVEMAYAMDRAGYPVDANSLFDKYNSWDCRQYDTDRGMRHIDPWEQLRYRALRETAKTFCPPDDTPVRECPPADTNLGSEQKLREEPPDTPDSRITNNLGGMMAIMEMPPVEQNVLRGGVSR